MACPSRTSAVSGAAAMPASSSSRTPWSSAVCTVMAVSVHRRNTLIDWLHVGLLELFGLVIRGERIENGVELAIHHEIQLMERQADAVIRDAVLREVVGANFLAAVAGAYSRAPLRAECGLLLF